MKKEADPATFGLGLVMSAKDYYQQFGDYSYLKLEQDGSVRVGKPWKIGYTLAAKWMDYPQVDSFGLPKDLLGLSAFGTWLHRLAVNVVLNDRQMENRRRGLHDDSVEDVDTMARDDVRAEVPAGLSIDLERAIAGLPAGARKVFVLHDVEGYTHDEIGELLGVTAGGCKASSTAHACC